MSFTALVAAAADEAGNWWEPGTPNFLDVGDIAAVVGLLITICGLIYGCTKWWMRLMQNMIREEIEVATEPIHPNSNGGLSLADVARRTEVLDTEMKSMNKKVDRLGRSVDQSNALLIRFLNETSGSTEFDKVMKEDEAKKAPRPRGSRSADS